MAVIFWSSCQNQNLRTVRSSTLSQSPFKSYLHCNMTKKKKKNIEKPYIHGCCSVTQLCLTLRPCGLQHTRRLCPSSSPRACLNSHPLSQRSHPTILSSVIPFSSCLQSFPASGSFPVSQFFTSGGRNIGVWASASVLPMNIQDRFPLGWTGWISLQSKGLSRVFSNITVQKHQFFGAQLCSQSNSHIHTWPLEKP